MQLQEVGALLVHVGPLCFEHFVETLALQTAAGHGEVHEGDPGTKVWWELYLSGQKTGWWGHSPPNSAIMLTY